ncbi:META domain-containing protein [Comamonas aquatilis]|uniref:META domain-containing protein n=1 Tax=Comamonas aquatilis TaxID=1778406 RepID=UPI0039EF17BF
MRRSKCSGLQKTPWSRRSRAHSRPTLHHPCLAWVHSGRNWPGPTGYVTNQQKASYEAVFITIGRQCNEPTGSQGRHHATGCGAAIALMGATCMACVQGRLREQAFLSTLAKVSSFAVQGQLVLTDADAQALLRFEAV